MRRLITYLLVAFCLSAFCNYDAIAKDSSQKQTQKNSFQNLVENGIKTRDTMLDAAKEKAAEPIPGADLECTKKDLRNIKSFDYAMGVKIKKYQKYKVRRDKLQHRPSFRDALNEREADELDTLNARLREMDKYQESEEYMAMRPIYIRCKKHIPRF